jgi:fucose permease
MVVIGGCGGIVESICTARLAGIGTGKSKGRMLFLSQFFYAVGAMAAPMLVGILIAAGLEIFDIALGIGIFSLLFGVVVLILIIPESDQNTTKIKIETSAVEKSELLKNDFPIHGFIWFLFTMFLYVVIESTLANWLPLFLESNRNMNTSTASFLLMVFWLGFSISRLIAAFFYGKNPYPVLILHIVMIFCSLLFFSLAESSTITQLLVIVFVLGFFSGPVWPLLIHCCSNLFNGRH